MLAMQITELGTDLQPAELARPTPGPGQVLLKVHACGVNFADTLMVKGRYQERPDLPFAPGLEICGTIEEFGEGVEGLTKGTRVAALCGHGGFAEYALADARACTPVPDAMSNAEVAGFLVAYGTSHVALDHRARMQPGENLLVLGAAGGVGLTAIEIGKLMGANVIACARGAEKLQIAKEMGADHLIDSETDDIRDAVRALGGADVVYDPIGGDQFKAAMRATNPQGRLLPLGFASGEVPQIPSNIVMVKNLTVIGIYWGGYIKFAPAVLSESTAQLFRWYEEGRLSPHISHQVPLSQANDALELLRSRKSTGKVVVTMG